MFDEHWLADKPVFSWFARTGWRAKGQVMAKRCFVEFERRRIACEDCEALSIGDVDLLSWDSRTKTATSLLWFRILPDLMRRWQESAWFRSGYYILEGKHFFFVVEEGLVWEVLIYSVSILLPGTFHTTETKHSSKTNCHCNPTHVGPSSSL
jgi:hypothetical protein